MESAVLFVPTDEVYRFPLRPPRLSLPVTSLELVEMVPPISELALLPIRAKPDDDDWKVAVVADVAVDAVDLECFSRFRFRRLLRICFLCTSTKIRVRQPATMAAVLR